MTPVEHKTRTFLDSAVLIAAARGKDAVASKALAVLDDPSRNFVTSDFVRLEVLPKPLYNKYVKEAEFYQEYFDAVEQHIPSSASLIEAAYSEATAAGLSAVDAIHVAAAKEAKSDEFITCEKNTKPLFRIKTLTLKTLRQ
jgi:predicted nucleic acid-binding protein